MISGVVRLGDRVCGTNLNDAAAHREGRSGRNGPKALALGMEPKFGSPTLALQRPKRQGAEFRLLYSQRRITCIALFLEEISWEIMSLRKIAWESTAPKKLLIWPLEQFSAFLLFKEILNQWAE